MSESLSIDEQRHHLKVLPIVEWLDSSSDGNELSKHGCIYCGFGFTVEWDYDQDFEVDIKVTYMEEMYNDTTLIKLEVFKHDADDEDAVEVYMNYDPSEVDQDDVFPNQEVSGTYLYNDFVKKFARLNELIYTHK